jgi:hypothetical protein
MKFINKTDIIIISVIIIICVISLGVYKSLNTNTPVIAEIYFDSQLVKSIDLQQGTELVFSIPGHDHVVFHLYPDGSICFEKSNCRDKICVRSGRLNMVGEYAACLPNNIIMKISRKDKRASDDADIIIGAEG